MAKCARCGAETDLHELDVPICPGCIASREGIRESLDTLSAELKSSRELYRQAMEEYEHKQTICRHLPAGHPERAAMALSEKKAKTAGERYWDLLRVYSDALRRNDG